MRTRRNWCWLGCSESEGRGTVLVKYGWYRWEGVRGRGPREICTLSREVAVSMSWNDFKFMMIKTSGIRKINRYMYDLAPQIRGMVVETETKTMQKAV
ncbi:hypothetical protein Tco_0665533 [Tanacetum coccineum]